MRKVPFFVDFNCVCGQSNGLSPYSGLGELQTHGLRDSLSNRESLFNLKKRRSMLRSISCSGELPCTLDCFPLEDWRARTGNVVVTLCSLNFIGK